MKVIWHDLPVQMSKTLSQCAVSSQALCVLPCEPSTSQYRSVENYLNTEKLLISKSFFAFLVGLSQLLYFFFPDIGWVGSDL